MADSTLLPSAVRLCRALGCIANSTASSSDPTTVLTFLRGISCYNQQRLARPVPINPLLCILASRWFEAEDAMVRRSAVAVMSLMGSEERALETMEMVGAPAEFHNVMPNGKPRALLMSLDTLNEGPKRVPIAGAMSRFTARGRAHAALLRLVLLCCSVRKQWLFAACVIVRQRERCKCVPPLQRDRRTQLSLPPADRTAIFPKPGLITAVPEDIAALSDIIATPTPATPAGARGFGLPAEEDELTATTSAAGEH